MNPDSKTKIVKIAAYLFLFAAILMCVLDWILFPYFFRKPVTSYSQQLAISSLLALPAVFFSLYYKYLRSEQPQQDYEELTKKPSSAFIITMILIVVSSAAAFAIVILKNKQH